MFVQEIKPLHYQISNLINRYTDEYTTKAQLHKHIIYTFIAFDVCREKTKWF